MGNLSNSKFDVYRGAIGNRKPCTSCLKCGKDPHVKNVICHLDVSPELLENLEPEPPLLSPGINEVKIKKPEYDKSEVYRQIEQLVRDAQDGRTIHQLLEVEPEYFVYCETNINTWESKNYYVNYSWDGFTVKADFTNKATKVITNASESEEDPLMQIDWENLKLKK